MGMLFDNDGFYREECFPVSAFASVKYSTVKKYYLTGRIHSKYALFWMKDENGINMEETQIEIKDGLLSYMIETNRLKRSMCFKFLDDDTVIMKYVAYSISILETTRRNCVMN